MAYEQVIKTLKIQGKNKILLHPVDWISGLNHDDDYNDEKIRTKMKIKNIKMKSKTTNKLMKYKTKIV